MSQAKPPAKRRKKRHPINVHLVSEATGGLALHMATVALSQFPKLEYHVREHPLCTTTEDLREARRVIEKDASPLVFSALSTPRLNQTLVKWCERRGVDHFDLMGSVIDFVATNTGHKPVHDASRAHRCNDEYYNRIDAWEFTLQHDDSRRLETIGEADVILLGLSRVGKTPLAAYLGSLGHRVANVSIAPQTAVPSQIRDHREKTMGLTVEPERLAEVRKRRFELNRFKQALRQLHRREHQYYSLRTALNDVIFAETLFRRLGIHTLDVTNLTVEESAVHILKTLEIDESQ